MSNISVVCFAASYAVALALEISRLFFRSGIRGALMIVFGALGFLAQTIFLVSRFTESPSQGWLDWYLLTAWILAAVYLYLTFYHPKNPIKMIVVPRSSASPCTKPQVDVSTEKPRLSGKA